MIAQLRLQSKSTSLVDVLRQEHATAAVQVMGVVGFALLTALGAQVRIYIWEVPFTLQTFAAYGSGLYLGWRSGMMSQLLYLCLGMFMPVFAGDTFGPAYLFAGLSGGYLIALPLAAAVTGTLSRRWNTLPGAVLSTLAGSAVLFTIGVIWLHYAAGHTTWAESIDKGWLRFIPLDLAKIMAVCMLYTGTRHLGRRG
jgi:biotin transport system substrate-specific component